jgi:hypothetical protein
MSEDAEVLSWYDALAEDPEYYMKTEEGQKELADMIRRESERLLTELGKSVKKTREVIWLSRRCADCKFFSNGGRKQTCSRWEVRLIKPFYGRAIWSKVPKGHSDEKEIVVHDIDWDSKWREISDTIVEKAVDMVNGGYPYFCFTGR